MLIQDLATSGALPSLTATLAVAGQRQRMLTHNIANIDTPDFQPRDLDIPAFRRELAAAIDRRREATGGLGGPLDIRPTRDVSFDEHERVTFTPRMASGGVLYHDRNNRDVERLMQGLAENSLTFRMTTDLIRREHDLLRVAISQRV
ncbi:MAG: flagellar basal-body rod protein FlgB [Phycisphaerae bacterium]|nr:MAG: flagellar basal-body rod protein FlgB [Phycisphaerae bacterium]